ncbi:MAG: hypothetical protein AB7U05_04255 [Mangrovibacterium sp.]
MNIRVENRQSSVNSQPRYKCKRFHETHEFFNQFFTATHEKDPSVQARVKKTFNHFHISKFGRVLKNIDQCSPPAATCLTEISPLHVIVYIIFTFFVTPTTAESI